MTETQIDHVNTVLTFEDETITPMTAPAGAGAAAGDEAAVGRLKMLLRPVIVEILRDELDLDLRIGG